MQVPRRFRALLTVPLAAVLAALPLAVSPAASAAPAAQRWRVVLSDPQPPTDTWEAAAATAPGDVWVAGKRPYDSEESFGGPVTAHWDGHRWRRYGLGPGSTYSISIAARPAAEAGGSPAAWVSWDDDTVDGLVGRVARWTGSGWHATTAKGLAPYRGGIAATPGRGWVLGTYHSVAYLKDGATSWVRSRAITKGRLLALAARTKNDVWAVGDTHEDLSVYPPVTWQPLAAHWDGTAWTRTKVPVSGCHLTSVTIPAAGDAWTTCLPNKRENRPYVLRWRAGSWHVVDSPSSVSGRSVTASPDGQAWLTGPGQVVNHWDGTAWSASTVPLPAPAGTYLQQHAAAVTYVPGTRASAYSVGGCDLDDDADTFHVAATVWRTG